MIEFSLRSDGNMWLCMGGVMCLLFVYVLVLGNVIFLVCAWMCVCVHVQYVCVFDATKSCKINKKFHHRCCHWVEK